MRSWFDTEFIEDGRTIELLSIGIVRADGATYYAEPAETDRSRASPWVAENVLPHLTGPVKPRAIIAAEIVEFVGPKPELWAYYGSYDWVVLCQLFGTMMDLPKGWPMWVRDIKQLAQDLGDPKLPAQGKGEHNALADAIWTRDAWRFLTSFDVRVEEVAKLVYSCIHLGAGHSTQTWVDGLSTIAQDEARRTARLILRAIPYSPPTGGPKIVDAYESAKL